MVSQKNRKGKMNSNRKMEEDLRKKNIPFHMTNRDQRNKKTRL